MREKLLDIVKIGISWSKDSLRSVIKETTTRLEKLTAKLDVAIADENSYSSLSPIDNGDKAGHYSKAILWALKNRKKEDIKNIALTGPYGSGKSSILKTFQKNYIGKDLTFLNISLATFKEEKTEYDVDGKEIKIDKPDLLRLIEISILEQIFYHEKDANIPDSRFKKIKSYSIWKLIGISLLYLLFFITALYNWFNPSLIQIFFKDFTINSTSTMSYIIQFVHYANIVVILLAVFYIVFKSVRIISAISINKLKIQNAEIGIGENLNKSVLNHHIDELLYFFTVRPYNVVIIEDLDRFQETEIFTKLREVNLLLNNSKKTKDKGIVFIYAVRDDMFTDKERIKFFDFIIPIIPVINSSNSSEIMYRKKKDYKYEISDALIENISFFIDDMRLLNNIFNEFYLYKVNLTKELNQDKLFAILTYKNIYPNDFMKLSNNEGDLHSVLNSKNSYLQKEIIEIENQITHIKNEIKSIENLSVKNIRDLRTLYIAYLITLLPGFNSFVINDVILTADEVVSDVNFEYIKINNYKYNQLRYDVNSRRETSRNIDSPIEFTLVEKSVDSSNSYAKREKEINDYKAGKANTLKDKITDLEKQKVSIRNFKIADLIKSDRIKDLGVSRKLDKHFIYILLRNGYIAEDYIDYISLFHAESITHTDHQFHISIKNGIQLPFGYTLTKIEKLVSKINSLDFQTVYILNYNLLDFLLLNEVKYKLQISEIFTTLKNETECSISFIVGFYEVTTNLNTFIRILCINWDNIWNYIERSHVPDEIKANLFKSIIEYANIESILAINKHSNFYKKIISTPLILGVTENYSKFQEIIKALNIVFKDIDFEHSPDEMLNYIYKNNYYEINSHMIGSLIKKYGQFNQVLSSLAQIII